MSSFRLDRQEWIPIVEKNGVSKRVSLADVFTDATTLSNIGGSPLEAVAITRFLLAIAHLVETPTSLENWSKLWKSRREFTSRCAQYVTAQADAWDLFDGNLPFGQILDLKKTCNPAHILVYEAARKNNAVFIDHSQEATPVPVSEADLACGLIVTNAFAGSSGGGYRSGPLAMRTVAMLYGRTFDETLLLNLLLQQDQPAPYDWKTYGYTRDTETDSIDLVRRYLWTSRRVRLITGENGADVSTMMLAPGNEMPDSARREDPMVAMRKDSKGKDYVPLRLESGRALWRSAHVLLNWHEEVRRLAVVDQLHKLVRREFIQLDLPISMRVCSVAGDAQGPSTELWRDETLPFGISAIVDENRFANLERAINAAEKKAAQTRKRIYLFAMRYLQNGAASSPDKRDVGSLADELSPDLMEFWSHIAPIGERIACDGFDEIAWTKLLQEASNKTFKRAVDRLPSDARRFRAEFAKLSSGEKKKGRKKGAKA